MGAYVPQFDQIQPTPQARVMTLITRECGFPSQGLLGKACKGRDEGQFPVC